MGWHLARIAWAYTGDAEVWHDRGGTPLIARAAWRPDEDDAQCLQVLECMLARGHAYQLSGDGALHRAAFGPAEDHREVRDPERRIALLRAALAALR